MSVVDRLANYTPQQLIDAAEATRAFINDPTIPASDRATFRQLLRVIEDVMRERVK
jgi:hypothetical protein